MSKKREAQAPPSRVILGRTESVPGEYANIHVEVEIHGTNGETIPELLERASRLVSDGIRAEYRKRRLRQGAERSTLEQFSDEEATA